jgi:hypothetical protein
MNLSGYAAVLYAVMSPLPQIPLRLHVTVEKKGKWHFSALRIHKPNTNSRSSISHINIYLIVARGKKDANCSSIGTFRYPNLIVVPGGTTSLHLQRDTIFPNKHMRVRQFLVVDHQ